ncbi:M24 family metallopeptidase [Thermodesulfobacteriota bacterium]
MIVPAKEMESRWRLIRDTLDRAELTGLLVFCNQLCLEPIHYLANYALLGERAFACLGPEGEPVLFISEKWDQERVMKEVALQDVRVLGQSWPQEVATVLKSGGGHLGIAGREFMHPLELNALEAAIGKDMVSATRLLEDMATTKSPYELNLIRESSEMADAGFMQALEVLREGVTDYELVAEIDHVMRKMGATDNFQMIAVGKDNTGMSLPCGKKVERGDLLLFEITPANGSVTYSAQLCRTVIFGEPPGQLLREKYALLIDALRESLAVIRPGVQLNEVTKIQNKVIGEAGYADYCHPPYMRARGHGFGLGRIGLTEEATLEFAEGMSLVVHPNQFIPETGYLALGESIIVTETGIERLTGTESSIYECGGVSR